MRYLTFTLQKKKLPLHAIGWSHRMERVKATIYYPSIKKIQEFKLPMMNNV